MQMTRSDNCDTYFMGDGKLDEVDEVKLLGVTFSKDLSLYSHIDAISRKVLSNSLVSSLNVHETCPLMLCLTSIKLLYCPILFIVFMFGPLIKEITWIG